MIVVHLVRSFEKLKYKQWSAKDGSKKKQARIHSLVKKGIDIQERKQEKKAGRQNRKSRVRVTRYYVGERKFLVIKLEKRKQALVWPAIEQMESLKV